MNEEQVPTSNKKGSQSLYIFLFFAVTLVLGLLVMKSFRLPFDTLSQSTNNPTVTPESTNNGKTSGMVPTNDTKPDKIVVVKATNYKFDITEIKVKKGDRVIIELDNTEGVHDWVVDEFSARTKVLKANEKETVEFTADKSGVFEYYCSVGKHREMGMVGKLIVE